MSDALERHVEGVGAVEREDEALRAFAVEELVEPVAAVVEGALGGEGHLVPGPAGVGEVVPGEAVERLVDGLGLGETGGGVVEVDGHGSTLDGTGIAPTAWPTMCDRHGVIRAVVGRCRYVGDLPPRGWVYDFDRRSGMLTIQYIGDRSRA